MDYDEKREKTLHGIEGFDDFTEREKLISKLAYNLGVMDAGELFVDHKKVQENKE